jgi:hypothetical protein
VRHKKIVFVGKDANMDRRFLGWSYVDDLLPQLVTAHPQYARTLESAWAAARHWELVEPQDAPDRRPSWHLCLWELVEPQDAPDRRPSWHLCLS